MATDVQILIGAKGDTGAQGAPGEPGAPLYIGGMVESTSDLPSAQYVPDNCLYAVNNTLYAPIKSTNTWVALTISFARTIISKQDGGFGADVSSVLANSAFLGPRTGTSGEPTWRAITADDIESVDIATVMGTIPVPKGGTGLTTITRNAVLVGDGVSAPKRIASAKGAFYATADNAEPQFGTLPVAQGGTGRNTLTNNAVLVGNTTEVVKQIASAKGAFYAASANAEPKFGTLPVAQGGTGCNTLTSNAVLVGNTTGVVKQISSISGAFYATVTGGVPTFGTLPVEQGGTGSTSFTSNAVLVGNNAATIKQIASASGAFYASGTNGAPKFGTLPIAQGGTGQTTVTETSTIADIATASTDYVINSAYCVTWGEVAQVLITVKSTNALAVGATSTCCQLVSGKRPKRICALGYNNRTGIINTNGNVSVTHHAAVSAGGTFNICATYLLA